MWFPKIGFLAFATFSEKLECAMWKYHVGINIGPAILKVIKLKLFN